MRKHNTRHTGNMVYQCQICEFEATKQSLLEDHIDVRHTQKETNNYKCFKCEKSFQYYFLLINHRCFKCDKCNFIECSSDNLAIHANYSSENFNTCPKKCQIKMRLL